MRMPLLIELDEKLRALPRRTEYVNGELTFFVKVKDVQGVIDDAIVAEATKPEE